jgi:hypothetical protein
MLRTSLQMSDSLDDYLDEIIGGGDGKTALDKYLMANLGTNGNPVDVNSGKSSDQSGQSNGPRADYTPDENGYIHGRAATFATPSDLANYSKTGSLATGDNGVGAFGANTTQTPGVAIARDVLTSVYGSPAAARGKTVHVVGPTGQEAVLPILDIGPNSRNAGNNSVLELTPAATHILGSGDANGYKYRFNL